MNNNIIGNAELSISPVINLPELSKTEKKLKSIESIYKENSSATRNATKEIQNQLRLQERLNKSVGLHVVQRQKAARVSIPKSTQSSMSSIAQPKALNANVSKAIVGVAGVTTALAAWPVTLGIASTAALGYGIAALSSAKKLKNAERLIRHKSDLPLSAKGENLIGFTANSQAKHPKQAFSYLANATGELTAKTGQYGAQAGTAISSLGVHLQNPIESFGQKLKRLGERNSFGSSSNKILGGIQNLTGSLVKSSSKIPALATSLGKGVEGVFGSMGSFFNKRKLNAGKGLLKSTEQTTLLGGDVGGISSYLSRKTAGQLNRGEVKRIAREAAREAARQMTIAGSRADLTEISEGLKQSRTISRVNQIGGHSGNGGIGGTRGGRNTQGSIPSEPDQRMQAGQGGMSLGMAGFALMGTGAAITAPIIAATKAFASFGDQLDKMSKRSGVAVDSLSGLMHAASLADVSTEQLGNALRYLQVNFQKAREGSGEAKSGFELLGVDIKELEGLSVDKQFAKMADAFSRIKDPGIKTAAADRIFGDSGAQLLPLLNEGGKAIRKYSEDAKLLGVVMSKEQTDAAARYTDQLTRMTSSFQGLAFVIGGSVAPFLSDLMNNVMAGVIEVRKFVDQNKDLAIVALEIGAGLFVAGGALVALIGGATAATVALNALPIIAVGGAIAALVTGVIILGDSLAEVFGFGSIGFGEFLGQIQIGGKSINKWLTTAWLEVMKGFAVVQEYMTSGFNYIVASGQTVAQSMAKVFGSFGESIAKGFWGAVQGVLDAVVWLSKKVVGAAYELHIIDDDELIKVNKYISGLEKGSKKFTKDQKDKATSVYNDKESIDYFAQAQAKNKKASEEAQRQINLLSQAQTEVLNSPELSSKLDFSGIKGLLGDYLKTLEQVKKGEESTKNPTLPSSVSSTKSPEKVWGSFSAAALVGVGASKVDALQKEGNKYLRKIASNTSKQAATFG